MKLMKLLEKLLENEFKLHDKRTRTLMPPKPPCFDEVVIRFKFKLHDTRTRMPPKLPCFDEIVIRFKFNALKLICKIFS